VYPSLGKCTLQPLGPQPLARMPEDEAAELPTHAATELGVINHPCTPRPTAPPAMAFRETERLVEELGAEKWASQEYRQKPDSSGAAP
jgi:hypothetical protein